MKSKKIKIVFFGTPLFAVPALQALCQKEFAVLFAVTQADKPVGRKQALTPSEVKVAAQKLGIEVIDDLEVAKLKIKELHPEVGVVVAYGKILPQEFLNLFPKGMLNIHPSLLPKYRGPVPINAAILNGDEQTGVSIIKLDSQMDHGPILAQVNYPLLGHENAETLRAKLSQVSAELLLKVLPDYLSGKLESAPQDDKQATFTKILTREDGEIDWRKSAAEIERQLRAYFPWPGCYSKEGKFKIIEAEIVELKSNNLPGQLFTRDKNLYVNCGQGTLRIKKIQPEGKKVMAETEYINGYLK